MRQDIPLYVLTCSLLGVTAYLHSPMVAVSIVALWAVKAAEVVMTRKNRDSDIAEMMETMKVHKTKMDHLTKDITNVAERAKTILGDVY